MPDRLRHRFGAGGFRRFMDGGVCFVNARYEQSSTFTCPGHATLFTGTHSRDHGLIGNSWLDRGVGRVVSCAEDASWAEGVEPLDSDPGKSPVNLLVPTVGDELTASSGGKSRVFSVSVKDRAAIVMGGHSGQAYWFDAGRGRFVTNSYYFERADPVWQWLDAWNSPGGKSRVQAYRGRVWSLSEPEERYAAYCAPGNRDCRSSGPFHKSRFYTGRGGHQRTFPYVIGAHVSDEGLADQIRYSPVADEMTVDFVIDLMAHRRIGQGDATDLLAISFSAADYIGHAWGPDSLEYEDNLLRLDRTLARLFDVLDERVGSANYLAVLTSDHGAGSIPGYLRAMGHDASVHGDGSHWTSAANRILRERFRVSEDLVEGFLEPSFYLDHDAVRRAGLEREAVERALVSVLKGQPGVRLAIARTDIEQLGETPADDSTTRMVQESFNLERSGDVVVVQSRFWSFEMADGDAARHGSPYDYDTHVPIMLFGSGLKPRVDRSRVAPHQVAATVGEWLGLSGLPGEPLPGIRREH